MEGSDDDERAFKRARTDAGADSCPEPLVDAVVEQHDAKDTIETVTVPATASAPVEEHHEPQSSDSSASDSSDDGEDGEKIELTEAQQEIIKEMEDCLDDDGTEKIERVRPSNEIVTQLREALYKIGAMEFLDRYCMEDSPWDPAVVLSVLGFPLPVEFVAKHDNEDIRMFIPLAIQHFGKARRRLPSPKDMDELRPILEKAHNILVLTGAGISTSLGIPDFRSKHGLYNKLAYLGLSDPQEVFDIRLFREDPSIFYSIAKEILPEHDKYTPTHAFIKLLHDKGKLLRNYTQNIDNVEGNAGVPEEKLVQCHGSFAHATCQTCRYKVDGEAIYNEIRSGTVAKCPLCWKLKQGDGDDDDSDEFYGIMKPDITFFGESLPQRFDDLLFGPDGDARKADLVICIGTSLKVAPVSEIIRLVPFDVPQIFINKQGVTHNEFDITFAGGCDDVVEWISEAVGWELKHEMNKRLSGAFTKDTFPGGRIEYVPEQAMYKFINNDSDNDT